MAREREERRGGSMRDRVKKRAEERKTKSGGGSLNLPDGVDFFQPKKATFKLDFLPYVVSAKNHPEGLQVGELWWRRIIHVHFSIGDDEKSYMCPKTIGKPCPICEERARLMKDVNADDELIKALKPKEREVYNVIDTEADPDKVLLWDYSSFLFGRTLEEELREGEDSYADFAELVGGYTLKVRFTEKSIGKSKPFLEASRIDFIDREDYDESILDEVVDLDAAINVLEYDKLAAVFYGAAEDDVDKDKDKDEEKPSRRGKKEEEEEKPSRRGKKEEGEEEKPSRRGAAKKDEGEEKPSRRGKKEEDATPPHNDDDAPPFEEDEKPSRRGTSKKEENLCPNGFEYGKENDKHEECDKCPSKTWESCADERDRIKSEARKSSRS